MTLLRSQPKDISIHYIRITWGSSMLKHNELLKREQTIKLLRLENTRLTKLTNEQSICICKYRDLLKLNGIKTNDK